MTTRTKSKTLRDERIQVRMAQPLRAELERLAAAEGLPLAQMIRKALIEHCANRVTARERVAA
jgi:predicted DNA binding CopG/RHH family protein